MGPVARAGTRTVGRAILAGEIAAASARLDNLLTAAAAEIELLRTITAVADALPMFNAGPPVGATTAAGPADVDVIVVPIEPAAPITSARRPTAKRIPGAEGNA